jgi:hypothetical protein
VSNKWLLRDNQIIHHTILFITVYLFVIVFGDAESSKSTRLLRLPIALTVYAVFVLTTKMRFRWWIAFAILMLIANLLQIVHEEIGTASDTNPDGLTEGQSLSIRIVQSALLGAALVTIIIGFIGYMRDKKLEYKETFHMFHFLLGHPECKNNGNGKEA